MFTGRDPELQYWTPYSFIGNAPAIGIDPTGEDVYYASAEVQTDYESKVIPNMSDEAIDRLNSMVDDHNINVTIDFYNPPTQQSSIDPSLSIQTNQVSGVTNGDPNDPIGVICKYTKGDSRSGIHEVAGHGYQAMTLSDELASGKKSYYYPQNHNVWNEMQGRGIKRLNTYLSNEKDAFDISQDPQGFQRSYYVNKWKQWRKSNGL